VRSGLSYHDQGRDLRQTSALLFVAQCPTSFQGLLYQYTHPPTSCFDNIICGPLFIAMSREQDFSIASLGLPVGPSVIVASSITTRNATFPHFDVSERNQLYNYIRAAASHGEEVRYYPRVHALSIIQHLLDDITSARVTDTLP
jgi:hypothetical protein